MFDREITLNRFLLGYCRILIGDLDDRRLAEQPVPGANPPVWILGHLAISTDSALALMGMEKRLPDTWGKLFGRGSQPSTERDRYPSKEEVYQTLEAGFGQVCQVVAAASDSVMAGPNPNENLRQGLPTLGDAMAFMLTSHFAVHLGQISTWRRIVGLPPLF